MWVAMARGMGKMLHRTPRNAASFRIRRRAFRLVPTDGGLLVHYCDVSLFVLVEISIALLFNAHTSK